MLFLYTKGEIPPPANVAAKIVKTVHENFTNCAEQKQLYAMEKGYEIDTFHERPGAVDIPAQRQRRLQLVHVVNRGNASDASKAVNRHSCCRGV